MTDKLDASTENHRVGKVLSGALFEIAAICPTNCGRASLRRTKTFPSDYENFQKAFRSRNQDKRDTSLSQSSQTN